MRILVVGGTMFFGIPMINALLARGLNVTIATRGNAKVDFNGKYNQVILDRTDSSSVKRALYGQKFEVIIDKIAFSSNDVKALLENVSCDRYIQMPSAMMSGLRTASEFTEIFSAPARMTRSMSSTELMPPPTANGILIAFATASTMPMSIGLRSALAVMS